MGRKPKLYLPLTVTFFDDDRIIGAGDGPSLLYLAMCLRAKALGTDGRLSEAQVARLHRTRWKVELRRLAELGLVVPDERTAEWVISGWFGHNDPVAVVEARREADRLRKADTISGRNPNGIQTDSGAKGREEKGRKGNARGNLRPVPPPHAYVDDGANCCVDCGLPYSNDVHAVGAAS